MSDVRSGKVKRVFTLCGVQGCCPSLEFSDQGVTIKDDFGGEVRLTDDQWLDLVSRVERKEIL